MISQKAKYALRALVALAKQPPGQPTFIGEIAEAQNIPKKFLEQILLELKRHGIVASRRGRSGGYVLLRPAEKVTFGEVLRLITVQQGPGEIMVACKVRLESEISGKEMVAAINAFERDVKARCPAVVWSFVEPDDQV